MSPSQARTLQLAARLHFHMLVLENLPDLNRGEPPTPAPLVQSPISGVCWVEAHQ
jgi:hypothetical protein